MRYAIPIAGLLCAACAAAVAQPSVTVRVDSTAVRTGEPFALYVAASGERVGRPVIPHVEGLVINRTPSGTSQSTQIQFINGRASTNQVNEWTYFATAKRDGEIVIPPITVKIDGKDISSNELRITASAAPPPQAIPAPQQRPGGRGRPRQTTQAPPPQPQQPANEPTWDDVVIIECDVDKRRVYQGEPVVLTLSIWELQLWGLTVRYTGPRNLTMPSSEGFYATTPQRVDRSAQRKGFDYQVVEHTQRLYPMRSGKLQIDSWAWEGVASAITQLGPQSHSYQLATPSIAVDVQPLPEPPPDFSGAVGRFRIQAQLKGQTVEQGVPTDLVLRIDGEGNPDAIAAPALPALPWAHISGPATQVQSQDQSGASFIKEFSYSLTPLEAGEFTIPPTQLCYFDPAAESYKTDATREIKLTARPGQAPTLAQAEPAPAAPAGTAAEENIRSIRVGRTRLRTGTQSNLVSTATVIAPPALWCGFLVFMRRLRRLQTDERYARDYYARSKSRKRLNRMANSAEPVQELYRALVDFLADKYGVTAAGMTSSDARQLLESHGTPEDLILNVDRVLRACERDAYAAIKLNPEEIQALAHAAVACMDRLEARLRGRRDL